MHFRQYFCCHLVFKSIDHKPLKWLAIVLDIMESRAQWINMFQNFNFKILHSTCDKHGMGCIESQPNLMNQKMKKIKVRLRI